MRGAAQVSAMFEIRYFWNFGVARGVDMDAPLAEWSISIQRDASLPFCFRSHSLTTAQMSSGLGFVR